jgi:hypothetical protein
MAIMFATKAVGHREADAIRNVMGVYQTQSFGRDVVMLTTRPDFSDKADVYVGLPDERLFAPLPGFRRIDSANLPDGLITLIGCDL